MIKIVAQCFVKAEEIENFITTAQPLVRASQNEAGCISYDLHQDIHNPTILTFIETWADEEAIAIHNASEHFKAIVPTLAPMQEKKSVVHLYKVV